MTNYKEMTQKIMKCEPFDGNSVFARGNAKKFEVYSYNTLILRWKAGIFDFDNSYYSVTTSKLQNMLIRIFKINVLGFNKGLVFKRGGELYNQKIN